MPIDQPFTLQIIRTKGDLIHKRALLKSTLELFGI